MVIDRIRWDRKNERNYGRVWGVNGNGSGWELYSEMAFLGDWEDVEHEGNRKRIRSYGGCNPWNLWDSKDHGVLYVRAKWNCRNPV